jgi:hypothetical protein
MMIAIVNDLRFFILHFISFFKLKSGIKTGRKMICCIRIQKNVICIIGDRRYKAQWHKGSTAREIQVLTFNLNLNFSAI